ncbi:hypothetical protein AC249_AIPGENE15982, partial [Exaiptasia diaphana]
MESTNPLRGIDFAARTWKMYEKKAGNFVLIDELAVSLNVPIRELGRVIKWTFPFTKRERKTIDTQTGQRRCWVYSNI